MSTLLITNLMIKNNQLSLVDLFKKIQTPVKIQNTLAIVGQSGSGKSLTLKTILNLLPKSLNNPQNEYTKELISSNFQHRTFRV